MVMEENKMKQRKKLELSLNRILLDRVLSISYAANIYYTSSVSVLH